MIADAPYQVGEAVLTPRAGLLAGIAAAGAMLMLLYVVQPISGVLLTDVLARIGVLALRGESASDGGARVVTGAGLHVLTGSVLGLLYAVCQQRIPTRGLIGVGVFYGFVLWLVGGLLVGWIFGDPLRATVRSLAWLLVCLLYGLCLALAAVWAERHRPRAAAPAVPVD